MAGAGEPAGEHRIDIRVIPGNVFCHGAPGVAGPRDAGAYFGAVAAEVLHFSHVRLVRRVAAGGSGKLCIKGDWGDGWHVATATLASRPASPVNQLEGS